MIIKIALSPNFGEFIVPDIFDGTLDEAINLIVETLTENAHEEQLEQWLEFEN